MLNNIKINGFKSLNNFELEIHSGLNVLVGPNGSGKSNILSLFEFLSYISRYNLAEAVSRSGGAGTIFTRKISQEIGNSISIDFSGHGKVVPPKRQVRSSAKPTSDYYVEYRYQASVNLSEKGTKLLYGDQRVSFSIFQKPEQRSVRNISTGDRRWHVDIITQVEAGKRLLRRNKVNRPALKKILGNGFQTIDSFYLNYIQDVSSHPLYAALANYLPPTRKILEDVASGYIYNLNPYSIKQAEDIARPAEISADGSGLAATLFSIQERENGPRLYNFFETNSRKEPKITIGQLREMFCLINDNITGVRVENDALENKLIVVATVSSEDGKVEIPLAMLSDGTVKWFSLVTAVLGQKAIFSLEEPENFLHPYMQKEIVAILRESTSSDDERFSLMTTHSESLLNSLDAKEVVVVKMLDGKTIALRSKYNEEIREEINKSGFGLGHFYVSGALN